MSLHEVNGRTYKIERTATGFQMAWESIEVFCDADGYTEIRRASDGEVVGAYEPKPDGCEEWHLVNEWQVLAAAFDSSRVRRHLAIGALVLS